MNEYEKKAINFLNKTNTTFKAVFLKYDKYFNDDKQKRDIYQITLKRGEREYSFKFGQSINNSITSEYRNIIKNRKKELIKLVPTPYDVLASIQKYEVGTFKDFCDNFGYNDDSIKAEKIYHAVCKEYDNVCKLFNDQELEDLRGVE